MTTVLWRHNILRTVRFKNTPPSPEGTVQVEEQRASS